MSGVQLEFELDTALAGAPLDALRRKVSNLSPLHDEVGLAMVLSTQERFEHGQDPTGGFWLPSRRSSEDGGQPLTDKGHLRDSITHDASAGGVEWGSRLVYAGVHQFGALIMPKEAGGHLVFRAGDGWVSVTAVVIPARPYLGISSDDERVVPAIAEDYMAEPFKGGEA